MVKLTRGSQCTHSSSKWGIHGVDSPTYTVVTTRVCPREVVAFTLMEFSRTLMTGAVVSATTAADVAVAQTELAARQMPSVEHLQHIVGIRQC